jgi:antitoxin component YwqK of YwqJK toxin-antitoxin module
MCIRSYTLSILTCLFSIWLCSCASPAEEVDPCTCQIEIGEVDSIHSGKSANGHVFSRGGMRDGEYVGMWEHFDPQGNVSAKGQYSRTYTKCGEWTFYYPNGEVQSKGSYRPLSEHYQVIDTIVGGIDTVFTPEDSVAPYYLSKWPVIRTIEYYVEECDDWIHYDEEGQVTEPEKEEKWHFIEPSDSQ